MVRGTLLGISKRAAAPTQAGSAAISSLNIQANQLATSSGTSSKNFNHDDSHLAGAATDYASVTAPAQIVRVSLRFPLRGGPFRAENGGPVAR